MEEKKHSEKILIFEHIYIWVSWVKIGWKDSFDSLDFLPVNKCFIVDWPVNMTFCELTRNMLLSNRNTGKFNFDTWYTV